MSYLKLRRSWIILGSFVLASVVCIAFPRIDLLTSGLFFDGTGFPLARQPWNRFLHESLAWFLWVSMGSVVGLFAWNRLRGADVLGVDSRKVVYLAGVLILGAGLIVNYTLKDHFHRARPRDVTQFGGALQFTPPFVVSDQCQRNCSFSSGDAAGAFFAIALARALSRRRRVMLAAIAFAALVAFSRISAGAHFLSDTMVSTFVMLLTSDILFHYLSPAPRPR